jgi:hypothetical protein
MHLLGAREAGLIEDVEMRAEPLGLVPLDEMSLEGD